MRILRGRFCYKKSVFVNGLGLVNFYEWIYMDLNGFLF